MAAERVIDGNPSLYRIPVQYSAYFTVQEPEIPQDEPPALVIALHGYGQSSRVFIKNFTALRKQNFLVVAPQAINQFYWRQGKVGFTWLTKFMRDRTLDDTLDYFQQVLHALENQFSFDPTRIFLVGFSNGAAMAFRLGTSGLLRPAGIIACCGDLPPDVAQRLPGLEKFSVLLTHGKDDKTVQIEKSRQAEATLEANALDFDTYYYDGGHEMTTDAIDRMIEWLTEKSSAV